jgi:hypothetical protein
MQENISLLKEEEQIINRRLGGHIERKPDETQSIMDKLFAKIDQLNTTITSYKPQHVNIDFPDTMNVKGNVGIVDKIKAVISFPDIQKIKGKVEVVNFPEQKEVTTQKVTFPKVQKIEGKVDVEFPENQKVSFDDKPLIHAIERSKIPIGAGKKANVKTADPSIYVPVRLTDGQGFYKALEGLVGSLKALTTTKIQETAPTDETKQNASLVIENADPTVSSTKKLTKTVGSDVYEKTLSYNAGGDLIQVSTWIKT